MGKPNHPGFAEHRHDQSGLSLLYIKHGFISYRSIETYFSPASKLSISLDFPLPIIVVAGKITSNTLIYENILRSVF